MKGLKCIKLLILSTIFLPLFGICSNTSALKHPYSSLYLGRWSVYRNGSLDQNFGVYYSSSYPQSNPLSHPMPKSQKILSAGTPCYQSTESSLYQTSTSNTYRWSSSFAPTINLGSSPQDLSGSALCHIYTSSSWYEYSSIRILPTEGTNSTAAAISDFFGSDSKYMYEFYLPLDFDTSSVGQVSAGRPFHFHGEFSSRDYFYYVSNSSGDTSLDYNNLGPYVTLLYEGYDSSDQWVAGGYSWNNASSGITTNYCSTLVSTVDKKSVYFDCYFTSSTDLNLPHFGIRFCRSSNCNSTSDRLKPLWYNPSDFVWFNDWWVTTDNDYTLGADASITQSGNNVSSSPGYESTTGQSYESSLVNLFSFNFFDPFAPLFQMFTSGDQCSSIPILAGMLGSTETTYCPWFPASVRNVLTPVIALSASMLVFGFLVRWLNSSSGNMIEDSAPHTSGKFGVRRTK